MLTYKIHLVRAGSAPQNQNRRFVGQSDPPLSEEDANALEHMRAAYAYPPVEHVYISPLRRCVQTAYKLYPGAAFIEVDGLMDMHLGEFEGKTFEELRGTEAFARWLENSARYPPPGGEPAQDFISRVTGALDTVLRSMMNERARTAAVITHGGVIMALLAAVGLPAAPPHNWAVGKGAGYTLSASAQLWMREGKVEVVGVVPARRENG